MKNKTLFPALVLSVGLGFASCSGDHAAHSGNGDTVNHSAAQDNLDSAAKPDSSKHTSVTGDASTMDNSGSGGTKIAKDTTKIKKP